jgi:hypothetical protein
MLSSYTNTLQSLGVDELLSFATNRILTGCTVTHSEGTTSFRLNKPGYYFVVFNGDAATTATAGEVVIELLMNGVSVPGASATNYSAAAVNVQNLSFSTIIKVPPSCACVDNSTTLTLQNSGVAADYTNANITITKLC